MGLFKRHQHQWVERGNRVYYAPLTRSFSVTGFIDQNTIDKYTYGYTVVNQICSGCGTLNQQQLIGRVPVVK